MVELWNNHGGTVEDMNLESWKRNDEKVEQLMVDEWNI